MQDREGSLEPLLELVNTQADGANQKVPLRICDHGWDIQATLPMVAVFKGDERLIDATFDHPDVDFSQNHLGCTVLHMAVLSNNVSFP